MAIDPTPLEAAPDSSVRAVSVLADEQRGLLYAFVRRARRPVTREEAAEAVGISVKLAAFHLEKLVAAGLLDARHASPDGVARVGRKPKVYEPADADIRISIPERRPDTLADILLDAALSQTPDEDARAAALRAASRRGADEGTAERARTRPGRLGPERSLTLSEPFLQRQGFEPERTGPTDLRLLNCPFHPQAARSPGLVCGINRAFVDGFLTGLEANGIDAVLAPEPGLCCVRLCAARAEGGDGAVCGKEDGGYGGPDE